MGADTTCEGVIFGRQAASDVNKRKGDTKSTVSMVKKTSVAHLTWRVVGAIDAHLQNQN